jgi:hypothetical protein
MEEDSPESERTRTIMMATALLWFLWLLLLAYWLVRT